MQGWQFLNLFLIDNMKYIDVFKFNQVYMGTIVNRALPSLHWGSLKVTLTVPFSPKLTSPKCVSFYEKLTNPVINQLTHEPITYVLDILLIY